MSSGDRTRSIGGAGTGNRSAALVGFGWNVARLGQKARPLTIVGGDRPTAGRRALDAHAEVSGRHQMLIEMEWRAVTGEIRALPTPRPPQAALAMRPPTPRSGGELSVDAHGTPPASPEELIVSTTSLRSSP
jgi:hypothetical protein